MSPTAAYPNSFLIYSYGKTLLTPGQRLGYIALPPTMHDRDVVREALFTYQLTDYGWPDAVLQYALPQLEQLSIDIDGLVALARVGRTRGCGGPGSDCDGELAEDRLEPAA